MSHALANQPDLLAPDLLAPGLPASGPSVPAGVATRVVVVHAGARDAYQVARALAEADLLEALVTDFFWPAGSEQTGLAAHLPAGVKSKLALRSAEGLPGAKVKQMVSTGVGGLLLDKASSLPFSFRRWLTRHSDAKLGRAAGQLARRTGTALLSYSYYGYNAFRALGRPDMLFQMHPHPATMRRLFQEEIARHPESAASLNLEWELALPEGDFNHLVEETRLANRFLVASSFTRDTLIEHGAQPESIRVVPYGVDLERFHPTADAAARTAQERLAAPLRLLFVGRINQRKGLRYLLEALSSLPSGSIELTICGRVLDGVEEFSRCAFPVRLRPSVSSQELVEAYQAADLFVLPSIAEGFGQVLLEALASGLPILTTSRTAGPDLIDEGVEGFIVAPQRADLLADRIGWAIGHREALAAMGVCARRRAQLFSWARFRAGVAAAVRDFLAERTVAGEVA